MTTDMLAPDAISGRDVKELFFSLSWQGNRLLEAVVVALHLRSRFNVHCNTCLAGAASHREPAFAINTYGELPFAVAASAATPFRTKGSSRCLHCLQLSLNLDGPIEGFQK